MGDGVKQRGGGRGVVGKLHSLERYAQLLRKKTDQPLSLKMPPSNIFFFLASAVFLFSQNVLLSQTVSCESRMLIYKNQFKQPPYAAGGLRLNPRPRLCSFLILDFPDTRRRIRAHPRGRRPLEAGRGEGGNACAGQIKRRRGQFTRFGIVARRGGGTDISIPAAACAARQPVRPNKQPAGGGGGRDGDCGGAHYFPPQPSHSTLPPNNTKSRGCGSLTRRGSEMLPPCWSTHTHIEVLFLFLEAVKVGGCVVASP